jgi:hypothetical protein
VNFDAAIEALEECVPMFREQGDNFGLSWALHTLGLALLWGRSDFVRAREMFTESLRMFIVSGDLSGQVLLLDDFTQLALAMGDRERTLRLEAVGTKLRDTTGTGLRDLLVNRKQIPPPLNPEEQRIWDEGRVMTRQQAVDYALAAPSYVTEK